MLLFGGMKTLELWVKKQLNALSSDSSRNMEDSAEGDLDYGLLAQGVSEETINI